MANTYEANENASDYSGMTFDEAMAEVNKNPPEITEHDEYADDDFSDLTENEDLDSDSTTDAARNQELKESTAKRGISILTSLGVTVVALGGLGLVFYVLRKIRDKG